MALGRRKNKQADLFIAAADIAKGSGHPFYGKLNEVLAEEGFDGFVEELCEPHYREGGRPGIPPGVYFRMLFVGYFEGLGSQRGIAWRCADSLALREFLGYGLTEATPVHASMTMIRQRLPEEVFSQVFLFLLHLLEDRGLLKGKAFGIDATTLEANAAMKSIVRKDSGQDWKEYLRELARAEGIEEPSEEDLRRLDRRRKGKKVSNQEWSSATDPDSRITKLKNGRTHLAYKAEHVVELESQAIVSAHVAHADRSDPDTAQESLGQADANLLNAGHAQAIEEAVADKGYHSNEFLAECRELGVRTYIPERAQKKRVWTNKPPEYEEAFRANRRRVRGARGKQLNRWRSERVERTFAHVCETGGGRRSWLRGIENVAKIHAIRCAAYNLGLLLRRIFGFRKPRNWEEGRWNPDLAILGVLIVAFALIVAGARTPFDPAPALLGLLTVAAVIAAVARRLTGVLKIRLF